MPLRLGERLGERGVLGVHGRHQGADTPGRRPLHVDADRAAGHRYGDDVTGVRQGEGQAASGAFRRCEAGQHRLAGWPAAGRAALAGEGEAAGLGAQAAGPHPAQQLVRD